MIHLSYILQVTSQFSVKGQIEKDFNNIAGVKKIDIYRKLRKVNKIEKSFANDLVHRASGVLSFTGLAQVQPGE